MTWWQWVLALMAPGAGFFAALWIADWWTVRRARDARDEGGVTVCACPRAVVLLGPWDEVAVGDTVHAADRCQPVREVLA